MKTRKTKKRNIIRRAVAFLLCMTMVLGLGMQDVIEQVYAEGLSVVTQGADTPSTQNEETAGPAETETPEGDTVPEGTTVPSGTGESTTPAEQSSAAPTGTTGTDGNGGTEPATPTTPAAPNGTEGNSETSTVPTTPQETTETTDPTTSAGGAAPTETTDAPAEITTPDVTGSETSGEESGETPVVPAETTEEEKTPVEELPEEEKAYEASYEDEKVTIHVSAEAGVLPEDAKLSVTPIEKKEITDEMSEEEKAAAEEVNAQYDLTEKKLAEDLEAESEAAAEASALSAGEENTESGTADGKTLEGFIAYDISFFVDGEEIEPDGEVNVSFEFQEAVIPEGVSEDAEVAVAHLKEDESATDGITVENLTAAEMATVETTENAEVTKVELVTESFSSFVIYWGNSQYWNRVNVYYVDTSGNQINGQQTGSIGRDYGDNADFTFETYEDDVPGYTYTGAHINSYSGQQIYSVKYSSKSGGWTYKTTQNGTDNSWNVYEGERRVYLVYERNDIQVHFVSGADGRDLKGPMSLADFFEQYGNGETADLAPDDIEGYRFVKTMIAESYDQYEETYNDNVYWALRLRENNGGYQYNRARIDGAGDDRWIEIDNQVYFIYKPDDYQITTHDSSSDGITLNLFNYDKNIKTDADAVGFPFYNGKVNHVDGSTGSSNTGGDVRSTLGGDGYPISSNGRSLDFLFGKNSMSANYLFTYDESTYSYEYDSQENHALYDEDEERFYVYDYTLSPADSRDSSYADFEVGNFFPFNDTINPIQGHLNYIQYGREQRTNVDYWFGMSMSMNFYQPEDGRLPNGDAMEFEFRGDDDVFVYLDGVLILDLGGIHAAQSGSINFATGTIEQNGITFNDGIYEKYQDSGLFTPRELGEIFTTITVNGQTRHIFSDYYDAKMDFFYLERGAGASNCHIKFNMPPIPQDTIIVGKQITDANASVYSDVEFSFTLEIEEEGGWKTVQSGDVGIYDAAGNYIETRQIVDGTFILKHGERAYFSYPANTKYRVTETDVSSQEYEEVTITGVEVTQVNSEGETEQISGWQTEELVVSETPMVIFRNKIAAGNSKTLSIYKEVLHGTDNESYRIQVFLGDEAGKENGSPYTGEYWISGDDESKTAENGIITLQQNQTASIVGIPSGTSFKVIEIGLDFDEYIKPIYAVDHADDVSTGDEALGKLVLNYDTTVTITNAKKDTPDTAYIQVQKTFEGLTKEDVEKLESDGKFTISLYTNSSCEGEPEAELFLSDGIADDTGLVYTWQVEVPEGNIYYVKESGQEVQNYKIEAATINGAELPDEGSVTVNLSQISKTYTLEVEEISTLSLDNPVGAKPEIIAGKFSGENKFLVWTTDTLSASARIGVLNSLKSTNEDIFTEASTENTVFFSTDKKLGDGIAYQGIVSYYTPNGTPTINLHSPEKWDGVVYGTYTEDSGNRDAEIEVVNKYEAEEISIDLQKYGTDYEAGEKDGAIFKLSRKTVEGGNSSWSPVENYQNISINKNVSDELKLQAGIYKLEETKAPAGYEMLDEAIYFKVEGTEVTLVKEDGEAYGSGETLPTMWEIDAEDNKIVIKIKNNVLYDLPEAGGPGIQMYMLGGTLLMMAGTLLVYKKRKEEVLRS